MPLWIHKTGSAFNYEFEVYHDDGTPYELPASDFKCQLNNYKGEKIADLVIVDTLDAHIKLLTYPDSSNWPEGAARLDIRYPNNGEVTETFNLQIVRAETPRS